MFYTVTTTIIRVAVSTAPSLVAPVVYDIGTLPFVTQSIEVGVNNFNKKVRDDILSTSDLSGGAFTVTNSGVLGSLLSTPIINPPQSASISMHKIQKTGKAYWYEWYDTN